MVPIKFTWEKEIGPSVNIWFKKYQFTLCACHRIKERSIPFFGLEKYLCARCMGVLFGSFLGLLLKLLGFQIPFIFGIFLMTPLILDGLTQAFHLRTSNNFIRMITGLLFGIACFTMSWKIPFF